MALRQITRLYGPVHLTTPKGRLPCTPAVPLLQFGWKCTVRSLGPLNTTSLERCRRLQVQLSSQPCSRGTSAFLDIALRLRIDVLSSFNTTPTRTYVRSGPASPFPPVRPGGPSRPTGPGSPWSPFGPGRPIGPVKPIKPCSPFSPRSPLRPTRPRGPGGPVSPFWPFLPGYPGSPFGPGGGTMPGSPFAPF
ncbi:hypothetical protein GQX74_015583 [Glossina fuscipes]|nr:hypothetical protein GQX74_015583 [Glossina fuscipes]